MSQVSLPSLSSLQRLAPQFNGDRAPDYPLWRTRAEQGLVVLGLWPYVDPTNPLSDPTRLAKQSPSTADASDDEEDADEGSKRNFERGELSALPSSVELSRPQQAFAVISSWLSDSLVGPMTSGISTGAELWKRLADTYSATSTVNNFLLREQWVNLKMTKSDVQEFINEVTQLRDQMIRQGITVDENEVVCKLLMGLPKTSAWNQLNTALRLQSSLKLTTVVSQLIQHQLMFNSASSSEEHSLALAAHSYPTRYDDAGRFKQRTPSASRPTGHSDHRGTSSKFCHLHGSATHSTDECRDLKRMRDSRENRPQDARPHGFGQTRGQTRGYTPNPNPTSRAHMAAAESADDHQQVDLDSELTSWAFNVYADADQRGWLVDSGATEHMANDLTLFETYTAIPTRKIFLGNGEFITAEATGTVVLTSPNCQPVRFDGVLYVPKIVRNLLSIPRASSGGYDVSFVGDECIFTHQSSPGVPALRGTRSGNAYYLDAEPYFAYVVSTAPLDVWHERLGHIGHDAIRTLKSHDIVSGLEYTDSHEYGHFCSGCAQGKQHAAPIYHDGPTTVKASRPLQIIHSDVVGPIKPVSRQGWRYAVTFIDDYSRFCWMGFLRSKDEVLVTFKKFVAAAQNKLDCTVSTLRSDWGGEYISQDFQEFLDERGIDHQYSAPHTPQQNGIAERLNRTIVEMARCMLHARKVPRYFWPEAFKTAVYIKNRCHHRTLGHISPFEKLFETKPDIAYLRVFGCDVWVLDPLRTKLDPKSRKCLFLGYCEDSAANTYRCYDPETKRVIISRDVLFDETPGVPVTSPVSVEPPRQIVELPPIHEYDEENNGVSTPNRSSVTAVVAPVTNNSAPINLPSVDEEESIEMSDDPFDNLPPVDEDELSQGEDGVLYAELGYSGSLHSLEHRAFIAEVEPATVEEARASDDAVEWEAAIQEELDSMQKHGVYELCELPAGHKALKSRFVFKIKRDADGNITRRKARMVVKGYSQVAGIDYEETFAPVAKFVSIRILLALAAKHGWAVEQMDVKVAFLNGDLSEELYMQLPPGVAKPGEEHLVWRLRKSIYGLKQAPRMWYHKLDSFMQSMGFRHTVADNSIYVRGELGNRYAAVSVYVDDLIIVGEDDDVRGVKKQLSDRFDMTDLGAVHWLLGVEITRSAAGFHLSQRQYISDSLEQLGMTDCKSLAVPLDPSCRLTRDMGPHNTGEEEYMSRVPYRSAVGSLVYLVTCTRPDLAASVGIVSQFLERPGLNHWNAVKRIYRYLKGTMDTGLLLSGGTDFELRGYSDSDYAGDTDTRRSTTGYVFLLGGGAVSWRSKRQPTVALSTTEAEYMALAEAAREAIWLRLFLSELGFSQRSAITIFDDNQGAISLARNPVHHARTKHIDVRYHYVREQVAAGTINVLYCVTHDMVADILTKPLARDKHQQHTASLGLH